MNLAKLHMVLLNPAGIGSHVFLDVYQTVILPDLFILNKKLSTMLKNKTIKTWGASPSLSITQQEEIEMIEVQAKDELKKIINFAIDNDCLDKLLNQLQYLSSYGSGTPDFIPGSIKCVLHHDFAPMSMSFEMLTKKDGEWDVWFNGGLIYSGPGNPSDGRAPSLTMSLDADAHVGNKHMWSVHT